MRIVCVCLLLVASSVVRAYADTAKQSHRQAAIELLVLTEAEKNAVVGASAMADAMVQANPPLAAYRDVLMDWAAQVMTWEKLAPRFVDLYVDLYDEGELRELIAFYATPIGQKTLAATPEIARRSAAIGGELASQHLAELRKMIEERSVALDAAAQASGDQSSAEAQPVTRNR